MERMLEAPEHNESLDDEAKQPSERVTWWSSLQATSTRRALLLTALGGLLIAGLITALPRSEGANGALNASAITLGPRGNDTFDHAKSGDCLNWPDRTPDAAEFVDCKDEHRFEVAASVDMRTFPGSEYGPDAAPPSQARIQQISQEQCSAAVRRYLGARFDPNSRFTISMLWSGDKAWRQSGERRMLCGLQLPGPNNQQLAFKGKVADVDQSKVWPAGTCLGIDPTTNQPTDIPVDCAAPHAMEVTGSVNLAEKFPGGLPPEPEQDTFIKDACTRMTDAYLAPIQLRSTTLTLIYSTVSLPSWSAGSHQVSCSIGATLGNGGWSTLLNSAKGPLMINGQPPIPPPDIPEERLNMPPIPMPRRVASDSSSSVLGVVVVRVLGRPRGRRRGRRRRPKSASSPSTCRSSRGPHGDADRRADHDRPSSTATHSSTDRLRRPPGRRLPRRRHHRVPKRHRLPPPLEAVPPPPPWAAATTGPAAARARAAAAASRRRGRSRVAVRMSPQRFDELVSDALDLIPPELAAATDNVVVLVEDRNPEEPDLLGLYQGVALTERDSTYAGSLPDTITIYRDALLEVCETEDEVVDEVAITVIHEIAHHFGIDDDRLHELGWG